MSRGRFVAAMAAASIALFPLHPWAAPTTRPARAGVAAAPAGRTPSAVQTLRVAAGVERILVLRAQIAQGVLVARARRALALALSDLDRDAREAGVAPGSSELHERSAILSILVAQFRALARRAPARDDADALAERAEEIEWEARRIAAMVAPPDGSPAAYAATAVDAAAAAERIARLLLRKRASAAALGGKGDLAAAKARLQSGLDRLAGATGDDPASRVELQVAQNQAAFLFAASWGDEGARVSLEYAVKAAANANESLERLAARYERGGS